MLDVARFVREAGERGLHVLLRPGPYICAEWDFGGLPGWLLADEPAPRIRCADGRYLEAVRRYLLHVGEQLAPLTCGRGGPIVMVQVENEYGSFSNDKTYLNACRDMLRDAGLTDGTLLFTSDGTEGSMRAAGSLDGCLAVANFGSKAEQHLTKLREAQPGEPIMCGEFWCGWFDAWGNDRQGSADPTQAAADVRWMAENGASFSLYMLHGGTNWGFTSGANHYEHYTPTITSYDYWAPLDEAGRPTAKYRAIREILGKHRPAADAPPLPEMPPPTPEARAIDAASIRHVGTAPLLANLPEPIAAGMPRSMEHYGQYLGGAILYRTSIAGYGGGTLRVVEPHDLAWVFLDGKLLGTLDRRRKETTLELPEAGGDRLEVLVWALGRVNYGPRSLDRKGITERVELNQLTLAEWQVFPLPLDAPHLGRLKKAAAPEANGGPALHRYAVGLPDDGEPRDTYLDLRDGGVVGAAWVNGHALGRFWRVGPQQTLYVPACWLRPGENDLLVLDLAADAPPRPAGLTEPVLDAAEAD